MGGRDNNKPPKENKNTEPKPPKDNKNTEPKPTRSNSRINTERDVPTAGAANQVDETEKEDSSLTCHECKTVFTRENDRLMGCERCDMWYCLECTGMNAEQYKVLNAPGITDLIHWYCKECNENAIRAVKTDKEIEERCQNYMDKFRNEISQEIKQASEEVEKRIALKIDKLSEDVQLIKNNPPQATDVQETVVKVMKSQHTGTAEALIEEIRERERRKLNLIFFNMPEGGGADVENRKKHDLDGVRTLLNKVQINVPLSKPTRLGNGTVPRPLRITTSSVEDKMSILRAASKLQDPESATKVYINRDMTPTEQEETKKLVEEKKTKQNESRQSGDLETTWIIRKGKVIKGRPRKAEAAEGGEATVGD